MLANKNLPNAISSARIACTVWLLFMEPLSPLFMVVYALTGVSDVLDGAIARKYGTTSELGSKLDSIADILLYTLVLIRIFPVMWVTLPRKIWVMVGAILAVRGVAYITAAVKYHCFASCHTYLNKATGLLVFGVAFFIKTRIAVPYCWLVCIVAMASSAGELVIHLTSDEYDPNRKRLFKKD
ncbi:MAG: CDP-alcohol phosphatidyltransferase family protein [Firmicutes bacterium]|nr:CDP-alcohol phosphatidyltransferase family protein [Bacillota bacterium]